MLAVETLTITELVNMTIDQLVTMVVPFTPVAGDLGMVAGMLQLTAGIQRSK